MDAAGDDDPAPGGSVLPAAFYGLWPRFALAADADRPDEAEAPAEAGAVPVP